MSASRLFQLKPVKTREVTLGNASMAVPLSKLPGSSGYFLYFKLNDCPGFVEEGARLIAERIKLLGLANPYFVTPEASTLALAHVLRDKYKINGATIYKTVQINDIDPVRVDYDTVTSTTSKSLYLGKNKAAEMADKDIVIIDSICTTGGTIRGTYELLVKAGISPNQIVEATMLFTEGQERNEIEVADGKSIRLHHFAHLPIIKLVAVQQSNSSSAAVNDSDAQQRVFKV